MQTEQGVLRLSILVTFAMALFGMVIGVMTGSSSIIFDGVYTALDASMTILALLVSRLITQSIGKRLVRHFTMGFWHLEPMVLGLNGVLLMGTAGYALVNAVSSLLAGGRALDFDHAIIYTVVALIVAIAMAAYGRRANRRIGSAFLDLDVKAWVISAAMTGALFLAFAFGWLIQGTSWQGLTPYVDPAVLALVCLVVLPAPISTVRTAFADIMLVTPQDLKTHVDEVAAGIVARHGFLDHFAYVARVGRGRQIELFFLVPRGAPARSLEEWDKIRDEVGAEIGGEGPDRWLTIAFTTDPEWAT